MGEPFVPDLDVTAYSTDYAQLRDQYEAHQQELAVTRSDLESLTRDLDMVRGERDNAQQQASVANKVPAGLGAACPLVR